MVLWEAWREAVIVSCIPKPAGNDASPAIQERLQSRREWLSPCQRLSDWEVTWPHASSAERKTFVCWR